MYWKLIISEYGKIKSAEIEVAPLTLFVGDNNSGKSYLMSLLWGIQNFGTGALVNHEMGADRKEALTLMAWIQEQMKRAWEQGSHTAQVKEVGAELQALLREGLRYNKDRLVQRIFNSEDIKIKELHIELRNLENAFLKISRSKGSNDDSTGFLYIKGNAGTGLRMDFSEEKLRRQKEEFDWTLIDIIFSQIMGIPFVDVSGTGRNIYFPATRTGFMLTKDIINKVGRNIAFNVGMGGEELAPFTRPVNQFLDVINDLTLHGKGADEVQKIIKYLENGMTEGTVEMSTLPSKEPLYVPSGQKRGMPLRVVSAVVTELSPLILILKHKNYLDTFFYEEPEMCLHPQLQQKMAKVICQLVNNGVNMMVTTHSDIILQHINNMICLKERQNVAEIYSQFGYASDDLIKREQVRVYQLRAAYQEKTEVEELSCGNHGFAIPTFNDALDRIMDEAYAIQE